MFPLFFVACSLKSLIFPLLPNNKTKNQTCQDGYIVLIIVDDGKIYFVNSEESFLSSKRQFISKEIECLFGIFHLENLKHKN